MREERLPLEACDTLDKSLNLSTSRTPAIREIELLEPRLSF